MDNGAIRGRLNRSRAVGRLPRLFKALRLIKKVACVRMSFFCNGNVALIQARSMGRAEDQSRADAVLMAALGES